MTGCYHKDSICITLDCPLRHYQAYHLHCQVSAFVRCLDRSIKSKIAISEISRLLLASVAEQACLSLTWSHITGDRFSHDVAHLFSFVLQDWLSTELCQAKVVSLLHTCHISHCEVKSHIIWPIWKPIPIRFFKIPHVYHKLHTLKYRLLTIFGELQSDFLKLLTAYGMYAVLSAKTGTLGVSLLF